MLRSAVVIAVALAACLPPPAVAGPLPDPPFVNGGFVSPSATVLAQQQAIAKLIDKYVAGNDTCDRQALVGLHEAYPPVGDGAPETLQEVRDVWANCVTKVSVKVYLAGVDKIVATGTPACLSEFAIQNILAGTEGVRRYLRDFSFCDGDAANPDPITGLKIPDSADEVAAELRMHKPALKAGVKVGRCYAKATVAAFKNGGTLTPADLDRLSACAARAIAKGLAAVQKVATALVLPACLSVTDLQMQIADASSTATGIAALVFCAE